MLGWGLAKALLVAMVAALVVLLMVATGHGGVGDIDGSPGAISGGGGTGDITGGSAGAVADGVTGVGAPHITGGTSSALVVEPPMVSLVPLTPPPAAS